jgi:hypothetical protein
MSTRPGLTLAASAERSSDGLDLLGEVDGRERACGARDEGLNGRAEWPAAAGGVTSQGNVAGCVPEDWADGDWADGDEEGKTGDGQLAGAGGRAHAVDDNDDGAGTGRVARIAPAATNPNKATTSTTVHSRSERRFGRAAGASRQVLADSTLCEKVGGSGSDITAVTLPVTGKLQKSVS